MDLVPNTGAIRRWIIITKDAQLSPLAGCDLRYVGHQIIRYTIGIFTNEATVVRSNRIEVAQTSNAPFGVRCCNVAQYFFYL
jgi:hypothetical protein